MKCRIVDQDINWSESFVGLLEELLDRLLIGNIARNRQDVGTELFQ